MKERFAITERLSDAECKEVKQQTGLTEKQIRDWWSRERGNKKRAASTVNIPPTPVSIPITWSAPAAAPGSSISQSHGIPPTPAGQNQNPQTNYLMPTLSGSLTSSAHSYLPMFAIGNNKDWGGNMASSPTPQLDMRSPSPAIFAAHMNQPSSEAPQGGAANAMFNTVSSGASQNQSMMPPTFAERSNLFSRSESLQHNIDLNVNGSHALQQQPMASQPNAIGHASYPIYAQFPFSGYNTVQISQIQQNPQYSQIPQLPPTPAATASVSQSPQLPPTPPLAIEERLQTFPMEQSPDAVPTGARSPTPEALMPSFTDSLGELLDDRGALTDVAHVQSFARLAGSQSEWDDRARVLAVLNKPSHVHLKILKSFLKHSGLKIVTKMLLQAKDRMEDPVVASVAVAALQLLEQMPVDVAELREVKTGKVVKHFASSNAGPQGAAIQEAAEKVMASWAALVSKPAKESVSPVDDSHEKAADRKRERESPTQENGETSMKRAKPPKDDSSPKNDNILTEKPKPTAVPDLDLFKSLSHTSLPKIKKTDAPVPTKSAEAKGLSTPSSTAVAAVLTPAAKPSPPVLPVQDKIPSYRAEKAAGSASGADSTTKKRRVRFAEGDKLVSIRYFEKEAPGQEKETSNTFNITPHQHGNARDFDREEGKRAFKRDITETKDWAPPPVVNGPATYEWGKDSTEEKAQEERERTVLSATYYTESHIPPSPAEPSEEPVVASAVPKSILWDAPSAVVVSVASQFLESRKTSVHVFASRLGPLHSTC
ncbi:hypothetical protein DFJ77DRAFT_293617 [Powellomyces hirtus]|nr:hypothetical protein DFJ77DRAFT_293617 [Powellomyces hirtus]